MKHQMGIIGYGGMAGWHHQMLTEKIPELNVKGAYDLRPEAMDKAEEMGLHRYGSSQELLADPDIDLVLVATPNNFHKDYVIAGLRAGKNVISEKPVTMNAQELREIMAVERETGKLFTIHQNRRWDRDFVMVRKILESGDIGTPYFIESRVLGSRGSMHGWRGYQVNGGGMLLDWGVHLIDQALHLIDSPVVSVTANLRGVFSSEVDDSIKVLLRFENDLSYLLEMSTNCFIPQPRWHLSCTDGTAVIEDWECHGKMVKLREAGEMTWDNDIVYTAAGPTRTMAPRPAHTTQVLPLPETQSDSIVSFYGNVLAAMEGREKLLVTSAQALRVMEVIDLAFASEREKTGLSCRI